MIEGYEWGRSERLGAVEVVCTLCTTTPAGACVPGVQPLWCVGVSIPVTAAHARTTSLAARDSPLGSHLGPRQRRMGTRLHTAPHVISVTGSHIALRFDVESLSMR